MHLIHLIRHARPTRTGIFLGRLDLPLAPHPVTPSLLNPTIIYSSPLRRALDTARLLFPLREIVVVPDLAECDFGDWEGLSWDQIQHQWPETASRKASDWRSVAPPNGEAWSDFELRIRRALDQVRKGLFPAAVVAHVGVNSALAANIAGIDPFLFQQDYCEVLNLELRD